MARQSINLGALPQGVGGDTPRSANTKVNDMTLELYTALGAPSGTGALPSALPVLNGGTGATTASAARSNLGVDVTLASAVLDPQSAGGLMSMTTVSGFQVFKYANGQMMAQGPIPTTPSIAANTQFTVSVAIPVTFPTGFVTLIATLYPSVGNDFAIRNTQAPGTTAFIFCANGPSAQTFSGNLMLFGRWK